MSKVSVCNEALGRLGKREINDLDEPINEARTCKLFYDTVARELQATYDWGFNRRVVNIAANVAPSNVTGYEYEHELPSNYLRFVKLTPDYSTGSIPRGGFAPSPTPSYSSDVSSRLSGFRGTLPTPVDLHVQEDAVHTNFTPVVLTYGTYVSDPNKMTTMFRAAFVAALAARMSMPLTKDTRLTMTVKEEAREALMIARDIEGLDDYEETPQGSSLRDGRPNLSSY